MLGGVSYGEAVPAADQTPDGTAALEADEG
jgi:hypothetical protein